MPTPKRPPVGTLAITLTLETPEGCVSIKGRATSLREAERVFQGILRQLGHEAAPQVERPSILLECDL